MNNILPEKLLEMFASLSRIRRVQLKIEELYHLDEMKTPVHLCLGQEAVSVGVCAHLKKEDHIFSNHRSHGHYLAKGGDLKALIAELHCKETGCSKGRGGSMHLIDTSVGHLGSSSIVGGGISHAVGAALGSRMLKKQGISVTFFGDAASEQGVFFESMSLAKLKNLPVIFICENNYYSVFSHISARQPNYDISMRAKAFDIPAQRVDGMSLLEVYEKAREAIDHARAGNGPYLLDCYVQRWRGHAGAGDPLKEQYRHPDDLDESKIRDPLKDFVSYLKNHNIADDDSLCEINKRIDREIEEAFDFARKSPLPDVKDLEKYLFS